MDCDLNYELDYVPQQLCVKIYLSVIEESLHQLNILKIINKIPKMDRHYESYKTIEERFSKYIVKTTEEETMSRVQRNVLLFQRNFAIIETALTTTFEELLKHGSFEKLVNIINIYNMTKSDENNLKKETERRRNERKKLNYALHKDKTLFDKKIEEILTAIQNIKDEIQDISVENEIKINYIKEWKNAKLEELVIALNRKEESMKDVIKRMEADLFREMRIDEEILLALDEMRKDLEQQINLWKEKYDTCIKELDQKIKDLKQKKEIQKDKTNQLKILYLMRQEQINAYKQYKIDQERKKEELKIRNQNVTKLQAWWRGVMVRKGFGKFRKKKDKKGKKPVK